MVAGLAALHEGPADAPAVLLVPGYTGSKEDFAPILPLIASAGFRVTAVDLPGQYESPGSDDPTAYTPDALAAVVMAVAGEIGPPVHLLGHSFGGLVARAAVIASPRTFRSLVLMDSGAAAVQGFRRAVIEQLEPIMAASGLPGVYAAMEEIYSSLPGYQAAPAVVGEFMRRRFLAGAPMMLRGMGDALRSEPDRVAELAAIGLPTLVLFGEGEDAWPEPMQTELAARLGAALVMIGDALHSPATENPVPTAEALVGFWRAV